MIGEDHAYVWSVAMPHRKFDVFLSHNSADKPAVEELAQAD